LFPGRRSGTRRDSRAAPPIRLRPDPRDLSAPRPRQPHLTTPLPGPRAPPPPAVFSQPAGQPEWVHGKKRLGVTQSASTPGSPVNRPPRFRSPKGPRKPRPRARSSCTVNLPLLLVSVTSFRKQRRRNRYGTICVKPLGFGASWGWTIVDRPFCAINRPWHQFSGDQAAPGTPLPSRGGRGFSPTLRCPAPLFVSIVLPSHPIVPARNRVWPTLRRPVLERVRPPTDAMGEDRFERMLPRESATQLFRLPLVSRNPTGLECRRTW